MIAPTATYNRYDVVVVPFPFVERVSTKRRPALVLSSADAFGNEARCSVMAMITSKHNPSWPLDLPIEDLEAAGLKVPSVLRMKLFTLDHALIIRKLGSLGSADCLACDQLLERLFNLQPQTA